MPSKKADAVAERVERFASSLRRFIDDEGLQPGSRLPSERQLAQHNGETRAVVRLALARLEGSGEIRTVSARTRVVAARAAPRGAAQVLLLLGGRARLSGVDAEGGREFWEEVDQSIRSRLEAAGIRTRTLRITKTTRAFPALPPGISRMVIGFSASGRLPPRAPGLRQIVAFAEHLPPTTWSRPDLDLVHGDYEVGWLAKCCSATAERAATPVEVSDSAWDYRTGSVDNDPSPVAEAPSGLPVKAVMTLPNPGLSG